MFFYSNKDGKNKPSALTPFSFMHFLSGVISAVIMYGVYNLSYMNSFFIFFVFHLLYEIKDFYFSYILNNHSYTYDNSLLNSIADQIIGVFGFIVGAWLWNAFKLNELHAIMIIVFYIIVNEYGRTEMLG